MNEEKWKQVKEIFHQAQALPVEDRDAFLDNACAGDTVVREKVDDLLGSYESGFLEETILHEVVEIVGAENNFQEGQVIGRYRLKELIGIGGMGEVFLADDTELDRPVAFKVLHEEVAEDKERVRRFIQEAKAASALNHPNILTIHEIGSFEGSRYIVSEYIDGDTLRERMRAGLTVSESLEIACQIAAALKAAHAAGIVHRDIKPENIMLRQDGLVKVLDFGLAKLTEADDLPIDPDSPTLSRLQTNPGLIMGTVAYMSPEQARGQTVDSRTDLWSLGVVFHEMLTGESPFKGESVTDLVTSILKQDAASLDLTAICQELQPICTKALAKDKKARYQSAHDLLNDLQGEKKRMEYAIQLTPFISATSTDDLKTQSIRRRPTLSAEYIVTSVKRHKYATLSTVAAVLFVGIGLSVYKYNGAPQPEGRDGGVAQVIGLSTTEADLKMLRFPSSGKIYEAAISPDGKYVAYVTFDGPEKKGLRSRRLETSTDVEVVSAPSEGSLVDIGFSPDGGQIYYRHSFPTFDGRDTIYRVPVSGGPSTKIIVDAESGGSISPDGNTLAFDRAVDEYKSGDDVLVAKPDGSDERVVVHSPYRGESWVVCGKFPAWSPDGKSLACWTVFMPNGKDERYSRVTIVNVSDGSTQMRDERWARISGAVFMPDGSLILAAKAAAAEELAPSQLWLIAGNAPPKAITNDMTGYSTLSATRKGDVLLTIQSRTTLDLRAIRSADPANSRPITTTGEVLGKFSWTPDGRILFTSGVSGNSDIWIMRDDGSDRRQLTSNHGWNQDPQMTPDGKYIIFLSRTDPFHTHLFRMDADGKNLKRLTDSSQDLTPRISPDGKWVYYVNHQTPDGGEPNGLCKLAIDGGEPVEIADAQWVDDVSQKDGSIVFERLQDPGTVRNLFIVSPATGTSAIKILNVPSKSAGQFRWSPDGRYLTFTDRRSNANWVLNAMDINGKIVSKPLFTFPTPPQTFEWSRDGKQLAYVSGTGTSDAVVITNKGN